MQVSLEPEPAPGQTVAILPCRGHGLGPVAGTLGERSPGRVLAGVVSSGKRGGKRLLGPVRQFSVKKAN